MTFQGLLNKSRSIASRSQNLASCVWVYPYIHTHIHTYIPSQTLQDLLKESAKIAAQSKHAKSAADRKIVAANAKKLQEVCAEMQLFLCMCV